MSFEKAQRIGEGVSPVRGRRYGKSLSSCNAETADEVICLKRVGVDEPHRYRETYKLYLRVWIWSYA